jgi:recombination protein RecT
MATNAVEKVSTEVAVVRKELEQMESQFRAALPAHIPVERFMRVVMTALQQNPDLIACTRSSLWSACVKSAQDGLLPDGREGAIVPFDGKRGMIAQWMPMVFGLRKKVRNSGELIDWDVQLVYENDHFEHELGDQAFIRHRRLWGPRGTIVGGYSIAHLKDGGVSREIMSIEEIQAVRTKSRGKNTPWNDVVFFPEMCRKTIARRHSKNLPMSSDLDDLVRRDDDLYDFDQAKVEGRRQRYNLTGALDRLAGPPSAGAPRDETPKGEDEQNATNGGQPDNSGAADSDVQRTTSDAAGAGQTANAEGATGATGGGATGAPQETKKPAADAGAKASKPEAPKLPANEREYIVYAKAWIDGSQDGTTEVNGSKVSLRERWTGQAERKVRGMANVSPDVREDIFDFLVAKEEKVKSVAAQ